MVGLVPYAEHLSKKMNAEHVYRVANEADVITMVPCYPFVHGPYIHGTHLLDGGMLKINPMQHMLGNGYKAMINSSWKQLKSASQGKQQQLENSLRLAMNKDAGYFEQMANMPGAMFSGRLLARYAQGCYKRAKEIVGLLNAVMAYLGRAANSVKDATVATIRWVFALLLQSVNTMAKMALELVGR